MPLRDCDVLLGMPWHYDHKAFIDTFEKTLTITHRGKTKVLNVEMKGESVPIVSTSAISSIMKKHLFAYLIFVKEHELVKEGFTSKLEKLQNLKFSFNLKIVFQVHCQMSYLWRGLKIMPSISFRVVSHQIDLLTVSMWHNKRRS